MSRDQIGDRFATLTFERTVAAPVATLYAAWTSPAARAVWASPTPAVTVEFLEADSRVGGREAHRIGQARGYKSAPTCVKWILRLPNTQRRRINIVR